MDIPISISQKMNSAQGAESIHEERVIRAPKEARELFGLELGGWVTLKKSDGSPESFEVEAAFAEDVKINPLRLYTTEAVFRRCSRGKVHSCNVEPVTGITLGCDPELIVVDRDTGHAINAAYFFGMKKWGPVGYDGMLLEFRPAPSIDEAVVVFNMYQLIAQARGILNNCEMFPNNMMAAVSSFGGPAAVAKNIRTGGAMVQPRTTLTAGFHLHYGLPQEILGYQKTFVSQQMVKALDYYVGIPSIIPEGNGDSYRRTVQNLEYGKPGMFRLDHRTLEYRTPGAALMRHPALAQGLIGLGATVIEDVVSRVNHITSKFKNLNEIKEDADMRILYPNMPAVMEIFRAICSPTTDVAKRHLDTIRRDVEEMVGYARRQQTINNFFDNIETAFSPDVEENWRYTSHGERQSG